MRNFYEVPKGEQITFNKEVNKLFYHCLSEILELSHRLNIESTPALLGMIDSAHHSLFGKMYGIVARDRELYDEDNELLIDLLDEVNHCVKTMDNGHFAAASDIMKMLKEFLDD